MRWSHVSVIFFFSGPLALVQNAGTFAAPVVAFCRLLGKDDNMNQGCILYAEDDSNDAIFMKFAFDEAKVCIPLRVVHDGQEAIDYLAGEGEFADRDRHPLPTLVLLDLKMPRKGGVEVLQWMRQQPDLQAVPVIVFSASSQQADILQAYRNGANSYVVKPISVEERTDWVRSLQHYWLRYNQQCT